MDCRLTKEVGTRISLRIYWGGSADAGTPVDECPNCLGKGGKGYHNAHAPLYDTPQLEAWKAGGEVSDHPDERWPKKCDHCDATPPTDARRMVFRQSLWDTPSGALEPGCMYFADWLHGRRESEQRSCIYWDNCTCPHLMVILPNGHEWDVDCRASNCDQPQERTHRCWVRSGEPPIVTAGKNGHTCGAGGGSIAAGNFHGFLRDGKLVVA